MEKKETEEFLTRLGGAVLGGIEDATLECYYKASGLGRDHPLYQCLNPNIPPVDDLIVGGLSIPPYVIGLLMEEDGKKKGDSKAQEMGKNLKMFGEGNVCYSVPMVIRGTILCSTCWPCVGSAGRPASNSTNPSSNTRKPTGTVIKL